ncbi:metallopeptidase TldD-related protein [Amycolatopsis jejuensis]|uniref:metallopeptidase TldD-related protein n=1 Tax=Amycolatopsis jejuensis TaxID=330084 RepID=UPI000527E946|nr:metallopeptidase TldD-related protein [Amycolatopsis jejuensis]
MSTSQEIVEAALNASVADGCVVIAAETTETNLRWANNNLTTNGQMSFRTLTVVSVVDGDRAGVETGVVTSLDEAAELVRSADAAARNAAPSDEASPLVEPYEHDDDWKADTPGTSAAIFEGFAPALAQAFEQCERDELKLFGFAEHRMTSTFLGTSTGLRRRFDQPTGHVMITGKSPDLSRSAWIGSPTRDFTEVDLPAEVDRLRQRLEWAESKIELPPGRYETILAPAAVADLVVHAYVEADARRADEGRSVFASTAGGGNRIGERLSDLPLCLYSDPAEHGLECAPFDIVTGSVLTSGMQSVFDNGQPVSATRWVEDGRLANLVRSRSWARQTGTKPQPFITNVMLSGGEGGPSLDDMVAGTERGLLVMSLWYLREVDPKSLLLTGLTRDGVYLVENGRVRGAVNNFRFNESPIDLLGRLTEVGRTEPTLGRESHDFLSRTAMPPIRVPDFTMSSVSQAS